MTSVHALARSNKSFICDKLLSKRFFFPSISKIEQCEFARLLQARWEERLFKGKKANRVVEFKKLPYFQIIALAEYALNRHESASSNLVGTSGSFVQVPFDSITGRSIKGRQENLASERSTIQRQDKIIKRVAFLWRRWKRGLLEVVNC